MPPLLATNLPATFDDGSVRGKPIILGDLITAITIHFVYTPGISNAVAGPAEIGIDYMINAKWITAQSANKFRWYIAKKEFMLLHDRTQTRLEAGVSSYLLPMRGQEPIARQTLRTYHRQSVGYDSSSAPIDPMMVALTHIEKGQQSLTSHMGRLELSQATIQTHLISLDTRLTTIESDMCHALYPIYHYYFHQGLIAHDATHPSWYTPHVRDSTDHVGEGIFCHAVFGVADLLVAILPLICLMITWESYLSLLLQ